MVLPIFTNTEYPPGCGAVVLATLGDSSVHVCGYLAFRTFKSSDVHESSIFKFSFMFCLKVTSREA